MAGLEHEAGGVGGAEEQAPGVQGDACDGVLQLPHPHQLLASAEQEDLSLRAKTTINTAAMLKSPLSLPYSRSSPPRCPG